MWRFEQMQPGSPDALEELTAGSVADILIPRRGKKV